jgi:hypothetical protein
VHFYFGARQDILLHEFVVTFCIFKKLAFVVSPSGGGGVEVGDQANFLHGRHTYIYRRPVNDVDTRILDTLELQDRIHN